MPSKAPSPVLFTITVGLLTSIVLAHIPPAHIDIPPFPTTLPSPEDWNHTPFNVTEYLSSSSEGPSGPPHANAHNLRSTPGVYMCQNANWQWPCWWQPAVSQCVNPGKHGYSLGPDPGVVCLVYTHPGCGEGNGIEDVRQTHLVKPGKADVWGLSWQCGVGYEAW